MSNLEGLIAQIKTKRERMRKDGKRTTEPTEEVFKLGPNYDWEKDPQGLCNPDGSIPLDRCTMCGFRYLGWNVAAPFCNICHIAQIGKQIIEPDHRTWIMSHIRIPDGMTELDLIIREKKRAADDEYKKRTGVTPQTVKSDFKRSIDLV